MRRSLERAGNRLRSRPEWRALVRHTPAMHRAALLGPDVIRAAGLTTDDLLAEAWEDTTVIVRKWATETFDEALNLAGGFVGEFRVGLHDAMRERFAIDVEDAVEFMHRGLSGVAERALFADPGLVFGPGSPDLVPAGFVRQITAIAGGTADVESSGFAYVALSNAGTTPVGGVATGPNLMEGLTEAGASREGYAWVYGPGVRKTGPFEPHLALDGVQFENFDDPVLSNNEDWPPFAYYMPGDHDYCQCDFEPIILPPDVTPEEPEPDGWDEDEGMTEAEAVAEWERYRSDWRTQLEYGGDVTDPPAEVREHMTERFGDAFAAAPDADAAWRNPTLGQDYERVLGEWAGDDYGRQQIAGFAEQWTQSSAGINSMMENGDPNLLAIHDALLAAPPNSQALFRGMELDPEAIAALHPGDVLPNRIAASFTPSQDVAGEFGPVTFVANPGLVPAYDISSLSIHQHEVEHLVGCDFRITATGVGPEGNPWFWIEDARRPSV